jgi:hypothetical protein
VFVELAVKGPRHDDVHRRTGQKDRREKDDLQADEP